MVCDNFQRGNEIRDQQGGCSSKFLIETVEVVHCVVPFVNIRWNDRNVFMRYDHLQSRPSPLGMRRYESLDPLSLTFGSDIFLNHNDIDVPNNPCFFGDRVCSYENKFWIFESIYVTWAEHSPGGLIAERLELMPGNCRRTNTYPCFGMETDSHPILVHFVLCLANCGIDQGNVMVRQSSHRGLMTDNPLHAISCILNLEDTRCSQGQK